MAWTEPHKMGDKEVGRHLEEGAHWVGVKKTQRQEGCCAFKTQTGTKEVWHRQTATTTGQTVTQAVLTSTRLGPRWTCICVCCFIVVMTELTDYLLCTRCFPKIQPASINTEIYISTL